MLLNLFAIPTPKYAGTTTKQAQASEASGILGALASLFGGNQAPTYRQPSAPATGFHNAGLTPTFNAIGSDVPTDAPLMTSQCPALVVIVIREGKGAAAAVTSPSS